MSTDKARGVNECHAPDRSMSSASRTATGPALTASTCWVVGTDQPRTVPPPAEACVDSDGRPRAVARRSEIDQHPCHPGGAGRLHLLRVLLRNLKIFIYIVPVELHGK